MTENNERREIVNAIDFGIEVEAFIRSKVGQYLIHRAESEVTDALEALKEVNPTDAEAVRALQNQIKRAESIQYWMAEAIQEGVNAERLLTESDE
jgi:pyrroloquinoline quinone (PQQ) biosynthesis protein C